MAKRFSGKKKDEVKVKYAKEPEGPKYTEEVVKLNGPQIIDDKEKLEQIKKELEEGNSTEIQKDDIKKEDVKKNDKTKKKMSKKKKITIIVAVILAIILIAVFCVYGFVMNKLGKMNYEAISNDSNELGIETATVDALSGYRNIALLGIDASYAGYDTEFRTDCIIIASINKETNDVKLFSIYRDTYVQMELNGEVKLNKINQAYYNGVQNTIKTINENLDLNIKEYVMVDFTALIDIIDEVGGVEINVTNEELQYLNSLMGDVINKTGKQSEKLYEAGKQTLNGVQALTYSRIRSTAGSDYKRAERMRTVLSKVIEKVKKTNISELSGLADKLLPEIKTNITPTEIIGLIPQLIKMDISNSFGWPYDTQSIYLDGDYYCPPITLESNVKQLHNEVYNQADYEVPQNIKEISQKIIDKTGLQ